MTAPVWDAATIALAAEEVRRRRVANLLRAMERRGYSPETMERRLRTLARAVEIESNGGPETRADELCLIEAAGLEDVLLIENEPKESDHDQRQTD